MSTFYTTFLSKSDFSFALFLVTFEPLEIQQSNIPLLKALKCGINAVGAQGCNYMSTFCQNPEKIALLLHKMAMLFQSSGRGKLHDNATSKFIPDSSRCLLGLLNDICFRILFERWSKQSKWQTGNLPVCP